MSRHESKLFLIKYVDYEFLEGKLACAIVELRTLSNEFVLQNLENPTIEP